MPTASPTKSTDAIAMLKADHREAKALFESFESARTGASKRKIAEQVCEALTVHTRLEEEIFYPACRKAGVEEDVIEEALVEHDGAKQLIRKIQAARSEDEHWEAEVKVLSEQIDHHIKEEEGPGGIFAQVKKTDADLDALGERMAARKAELTR
jgi:hemerythrin superfamily protein